MYVIDQISSILSSKPSVEWIGPDIFLLAAAESTKVAAQEAEAPAVSVPPVTSVLRLLHTIGETPFLLPAILIMTSVGWAVNRKLHAVSVPPEKPKKMGSEKEFETCIRRCFKNQSERTFSILKGLLQRIPNEQPELVVFFASHESAITAQVLAVKLLRLIFIAKGEDKKLDEIEQEHVVSGKWYGRFTISWYFLNELRSALAQKMGIVITNFQDVHPNSAALLTFKTNELLASAQGAYLFLIINTEDEIVHLLPNVSQEESALAWWLSTKLAPHVRPDVIMGLQKEIGDNICVIQKESLNTLTMQ